MGSVSTHRQVFAAMIDMPRPIHSDLRRTNCSTEEEIEAMLASVSSADHVGRFDSDGSLLCTPEEFEELDGNFDSIANLPDFEPLHATQEPTSSQDGLDASVVEVTLADTASEGA
jgi:hypothetical protein